MVGILGGGLAGLTAAIHLAMNNVQVTLFEKQSYPHHKVCGEYVSNEVLPYLKSLGIDVIHEGAKKISNLRWTTSNGRVTKVNLPLGGFGMSRFAFDKVLYDRSLALGVNIIQETVTGVVFSTDEFNVETQATTNYKFDYVIGAFGKRSTIDKLLNRKFIQKKTKWLAVKSHYSHDDFPEDSVELHNFNGGYCGLSKVESNAVNLCYLTTYNSFQEYGDIEKFQQNVLTENKFLKHFLAESDMLFDKPLSIAQISFEDKPSVENHMLMIGDSAGLIHPLCGNGMAMAIHSAKLVSEVLTEGFQHKRTRHDIEQAYAKLWSKTFSRRLRTGAMLQTVLLNPIASKIAINSVGKSSWLLKSIIKATHGKPILP